MIHTNRCKHCNKTKQDHYFLNTGLGALGNEPLYCSMVDVDTGTYLDSGIAALDAHKEELYEAVKEYVEAKKEEKENRGNTNGRLIGAKIKDAYQRIESILNQIEKEK